MVCAGTANAQDWVTLRPKPPGSSVREQVNAARTEPPAAFGKWLIADAVKAAIALSPVTR